ncbi:MAG: MarR family transcriptional regulator [Gemmataceae bacterium]
MGRETDAVDQVVADWRAARPDLDPGPLELVGRVLVLAQHLERGVEAALKEYDLSLGQFDILATLRRQPAGDGMTPTALLKSVVLSSGGMTSRLDKLAERGLIARRPDPTDRRGVIVALTAKGRKLIDAATDTRFREAARSLPPATAAERKQLAGLLRAWLKAVEVG